LTAARQSQKQYQEHSFTIAEINSYLGHGIISLSQQPEVTADMTIKQRGSLPATRNHN